jgi:hypothetical protein
MKNISIEIIEKLPHDSKFADQYRCILNIANKKVKFFPPVNIWSIDEYKKQWQEGLQKILIENTSCIVTDVADIGEFPTIMMWDLFKEGDTVYCQGKCLHRTSIPISFYEISFTVENCYKFIGKRRPKDAIGVLAFKIEPEDFKISELWKKRDL